ncbi:hypothetical protein CVT24_009311 [Panaeolus cyanescens]|uniref:Uncharacterized protein n=1 Tax=Panaeolus cyanescens TaxID=181874 RepID=A0A409Y874_9AGAR|nr:hypothetical protein CVT24_009311 [Panaeolus cyanescens]
MACSTNPYSYPIYPGHLRIVEAVTKARTATSSASYASDGFEILKEAASTYGNYVGRKTQKIISSAQNVVLPRKANLQSLRIPQNLKQATFGHLFLSNDQPDDHDVPFLREALKAAETLLAEQIISGAAQRKTSSKIVELENGVLLLKSALSTIRRIPYDILQAIFTWHLPTPCTSLPQAYIPTEQLAWSWTLSQVCRTWRHVALSTPQLWNHLPRLTLQRFDPSGDCRRRQERLEFMIKYADELPLHLFIDSETLQISSSQRPLLELLVQHAERWGTVVIIGNTSFLTSIVGVKGRLNQLHRLSLFLSSPPPASDIDYDIFSVAPNLQHIFMNGDHHNLRLPISATLTHYEALLDRWTAGIGHASSYASTLHTLILQGVSLSPLPESITFPNLKRFSFRLDRGHSHLGALHQMTLPELEELVICGDHQDILTTTHALLARSASATKQSFPLQKIHISDSSFPWITDNPMLFVTILELTPSLQTLEVLLPPVEVLKRLTRLDVNEVIAPALECLEFILLTHLSSDEISALNELAVARCEMKPQGALQACKLLKSFTLYDEYTYSSEPRLMRCHRLLEDWWRKSESPERRITRVPSISSHSSGSAASFSDPFFPMPLLPLDILRNSITDLVGSGQGVQHISKQQASEVVSQLEKCQTDITVNDIAISRVDAVLYQLAHRLQNLSEQTPNLSPHLSNLRDAISNAVGIWSPLIDEQFSSVHWVFGELNENVFLTYVPKHHSIRTDSERKDLVFNLSGKPHAFFAEHEALCAEFRVSECMRTYPVY